MFAGEGLAVWVLCQKDGCLMYQTPESDAMPVQKNRHTRQNYRVKHPRTKNNSFFIWSMRIHLGEATVSTEGNLLSKCKKSAICTLTPLVIWSNSTFLKGSAFKPSFSLRYNIDYVEKCLWSFVSLITSHTQEKSSVHFSLIMEWSYSQKK